MFYDAVMLARAGAEIGRALIGSRVREVLQLHHDEVALTFGRGASPIALTLASSPQFGRVYLGPPPEGKGPLQAFGLALKKHLRGARLLEVVQPGFDRVLRLTFAECEGFGAECRRALVVEVMGKHGNMLLLDEGERILSCAKHVPARLNRYRELMEGEPYLPPPSFEKLDPREATVDALRDRVAANPQATPAALLRDEVLGASKVFAAEVLCRLASDAGVVGELRAGDLEALVALVRRLAAEAAQDGAVYIYERPAGSNLPARFAYPLSLCCCGPAVGEAPTLSAALGPLMLAERNAQRERELRERLSAAARAQLRELTERLGKLRAQVRQAEGAESLRRTAELLLAQPHAARPYASEVELVDYYAEDAPTVTVTLDPPGDVHGTARKLFDRCKRAARILQRVPPLIEQAEQESEYLAAVLDEVELAQGLEDLTEI
ncbi:MAG: hypothetical protein FJX74_16385, partial [Armatimonadetes bacterium]|nr:hypothetical protein [Armatimonadota bacterium]